MAPVPWTPPGRVGAERELPPRPQWALRTFQSQAWDLPTFSPRKKQDHARPHLCTVLRVGVRPSLKEPSALPEGSTQRASAGEGTGLKPEFQDSHH